MPILQYETQVSPEGFVTLPAIPEYHGRKVVVRIEDGDDWPTPTDEQLEKMHKNLRSDPVAVHRFHESRKSLPAVEITDEEIEELKHERRMRKML